MCFLDIGCFFLESLFVFISILLWGNVYKRQFFKFVVVCFEIRYCLVSIYSCSNFKRFMMFIQEKKFSCYFFFNLIRNLIFCRYFFVLFIDFKYRYYIYMYYFICYIGYMQGSFFFDFCSMNIYVFFFFYKDKKNLIWKVINLIFIKDIEDMCKN